MSLWWGPTEHVSIEGYGLLTPYECHSQCNNYRLHVDFSKQVWHGEIMMVAVGAFIPWVKYSSHYSFITDLSWPQFVQTIPVWCFFPQNSQTSQIYNCKNIWYRNHLDCTGMSLGDIGARDKFTSCSWVSKYKSTNKSLQFNILLSDLVHVTPSHQTSP